MTEAETCSSLSRVGGRTAVIPGWGGRYGVRLRDFAVLRRGLAQISWRCRDFKMLLGSAWSCAIAAVGAAGEVGGFGCLAAVQVDAAEANQSHELKGGPDESVVWQIL